MIPRNAWTGPFGISLAAIVVAALVVVVQARPLLEAITSPDAADLEREEKALRLQTAEHAELVETSQKRIAGRYLLDKRPTPWPKPYVPPPPPPPPPDPPPDPGPPPPPPPPAEYTGPKINGILAGVVIFDKKDLRLAVGQHDDENDLEVLEVRSGGRVLLGHKGGEYEVSLFQTNADHFDPSKLDWTAASSDPVYQIPDQPEDRGASRSGTRSTGRSSGRTSGRGSTRSTGRGSTATEK